MVFVELLFMESVNLNVAAATDLAADASCTVSTGTGGGAGSGIVPLFLHEKIMDGSIAISRNENGLNMP
jgi:hypothetical protein